MILGGWTGNIRGTERLYQGGQTGDTIAKEKGTLERLTSDIRRTDR